MYKNKSIKQFSLIFAFEDRLQDLKKKISLIGCAYELQIFQIYYAWKLLAASSLKFAIQINLLGNVHKWRPTFFGHLWPTYLPSPTIFTL